MNNSIEINNNNLKSSYENIFNGYQSALKIVDDVVLKNYITNLSKMDIVPLKDRLLKSNIRDNVRFFKITEMVYEKDEFATYKFASVFNALTISNSALFLIIDSDGIKTDFYMGVRSVDEYRTVSSLKNTVKNAMIGQFPGIKIDSDYTIDEMEEILKKIESNSISAVSCVANKKINQEIRNSNFIQGLEKLVLSMQGERYTGIIIANGTTQSQLRELRKGYESVYTQLSAFATTQVNYVNNSSFNYSMAKTEGNSISESYSNNLSKSEGESSTIGISKSTTESSENVAGKTIKGVATAASMLGLALSPLTGGTSLVVGGVVSGGLSILGSAVSNTVSESNSTSNSTTSSKTVSKGYSSGKTNTINFGTSKTEGYANGISEGMTLTLHDKSIEDTLDRIDKQLKRIDEFESLGMYECAAYFLSEDQYASEIAASTYKALMSGENSGVEIAAINSWGQFQKKKTELISQYVKNFMHPVFSYEGSVGKIEVTPCSLVSGNELAIHMGLPRKSVCGLPVIEHADFGKEIVKYNKENNYPYINLGNIFNMGSICKNKVSLDINSLSMHTFITGSTGSGKSNAIYEIIRQLNNCGINFMVIEPAKGEYKNIFGNLSDVRVLGTNPRFTDILRINPFKFPTGIHILEHIDRLVEIFNVCWPMYAAMPAVLKEAIIETYESCGWDLENSSNNYYDNLFPTFKDLLRELVKVIQNSAYSDEVKSNYIGSLVTRVTSLTNGLNGQIFASDEIDNKELFDGKVIIDLSRIGSTETKSLIMGILIMRLSEYRMSYSDGMNLPLKHVTILEEAHNILKKSENISFDGEGITSKSVEMISNAIAEMRTYGEGFIISDQSPNEIDISAIRNTNTKVIMRLPDESDRRIVGKAAALRDIQLDEIAKLPKGVSVVYQNDWVEPVLCKINRYKGNIDIYTKESIYKDNILNFKLIILNELFNKIKNEKLNFNMKQILEITNSLCVESSLKIDIIKAFRKNGKLDITEINKIVHDLSLNKTVEDESNEAESIEEWKNRLIYGENSILSDLDEEKRNMAIECILLEQIERYGKPREYLEKWYKFIDGEII